LFDILFLCFCRDINDWSKKCQKGVYFQIYRDIIHFFISEHPKMEGIFPERFLMETAQPKRNSKIG